jgi:chromate transporter
MIFGWFFLHAESTAAPAPAPEATPSRRGAVLCLGTFIALLIGLPWLASLTDDPALDLVDRFYRAGALVFGGGHVVLPLLHNELVPSGLMTESTFLAGYGAAQAVPGPLFTFAAYLGTAATTPLQGWAGGLLALVAIFAPGLLLVGGALPFWLQLRSWGPAQKVLRGANAGVVGILLAALYDPVSREAIHSPYDFAWAVVAFALLQFLKWPAWAVVLLSALAAQLIF